MAPSIEQKIAAAKKIPNYPGKKQVEKATRPLVEPWARRATTQVVMRLLGYWMVWNETPGGRAGIIERGWMGRRAAYQAEANFRYVFGVSVEDFDPAQLPRFLGTERTAVRRRRS